MFLFSWHLSAKYDDAKRRFEDSDGMLWPCLRTFEKTVSFVIIFASEAGDIIGSGVLRQAGSMSSPSSKPLSAAAHFADKKGIQLSPSIYLPCSFLPSPFSYTVLAVSVSLSSSLPILTSLFFSKVSRRSFARSGDERDSWSSSAYQTITSYEEARQGNPQFRGS